MRLLLDTHILLWALQGSERLAVGARSDLQDPGNEILFSSASIWEIAIKASLGRGDFGVEPADILRAATDIGFAELPVHSAAALLVARLPWHHRDPFDRLLVAQAISEPAVLFTADSRLEPYSELVRRI